MSDDWNRTHHGDCRVILSGIEPASVQCVVTSPPYWGLRDYGTAPLVWGGKPDCAHDWSDQSYRLERHGDDGSTGSTLEGSRNAQAEQRLGVIEAAVCIHCEAWRGSLGLEPTPERFVANLVEVFRAVHRVLKDDGVLWLNLGDSYHGGGYSNHRINGAEWATQMNGDKRRSRQQDRINANPSLKPKDLVGVPWMTAFALRAAGWYLRSDVIWAKPSGMPESVTDRPTKAHEYVFLLTKSAQYFFDMDAIREPHTMKPQRRKAKRKDDVPRSAGQPPNTFSTVQPREEPGVDGHPLGKSVRSVWSIYPERYEGAHFATMPTALAQRCILAGSRFGDVVLDPFMGSGTVGQVAESLGRRWLGCELNERYCQLVAERTAQAGLPFTTNTGEET